MFAEVIRVSTPNNFSPCQLALAASIGLFHGILLRRVTGGHLPLVSISMFLYSCLFSWCFSHCTNVTAFLILEVDGCFPSDWFRKFNIKVPISDKYLGIVFVMRTFIGIPGLTFKCWLQFDTRVKYLCVSQFDRAQQYID